MDNMSTNCNSHPHNYYLEIATALGMLGLFIISFLFANILINTIKTLHFKTIVQYIRSY